MQVDSVSWIALATSEPELAKAALTGVSSTVLDAPMICGFERSKAFSKVIGKLRNLPDSEANYPSTDLKQIRERYVGENDARHYHNGFSDAAETEILLIGVGSISKETETLMNRMGAAELLFLASLDEFERIANDRLRQVFGTGWFGNVDTVLREVSKTSKFSVTEFAPRIPHVSPGKVSAAAACKITAFGWLPPQWNQREMILGAARTGRDRARTLSRMFDEDVRCFPMPRIEIPGEGALLPNDPEDTDNARWLSYESTHPEDTAILAIMRTAYGPRDKSGETMRLPKAGRIRVFPMTLAAVGFLRRILPAVSTDVIGYTPGNSAATRSGVLERLARLFLENPHDVAARTRVEDAIQCICFPGSLPMGRQSPFDESESLDLEILKAKNSEGSDNLNPSGSDAVEEDSEELLKVLEICRTGQDKAGKAPTHAFRILGERIRLNSDTIKNLERDTPASEKDDIYLRTRKLEKEASANHKGMETPRLTRESHFPFLQLIGGIAKFAALLKFGRLAAPAFVRDWIGSQFRLVWIVPLDRLEPSSCEPIRAGCTFPGSRLSHRFYPCLFNPDEEEGAIPVDLYPLLQIASETLKNERKKRRIGWLTNRVSETNELMAGMMVHMGYVPDFPLESVPFDFDSSTGNLELFLQTLDSRLIIRCIRESEGGAEKLRQWAADIGEEILLSSPGRPSNSADREDNNERMESRFTIFGDSAGIAVAAFDCCRLKIARQEDSGDNQPEKNLRVYFLPSKLREHFRPRAVNRSKGTLPHDDKFRKNKASDNHLNKGDPFACIETELGQLLMAEPFNPESAASIMGEWHEKEGMMHGDSPEDLLEDLSMELFPGGDVTPAFRRNCQLLLAEMDSDVSG